jgi:hypothetical protein
MNRWPLEPDDRQPVGNDPRSPEPGSVVVGPRDLVRRVLEPRGASRPRRPPRLRVPAMWASRNTTDLRGGRGPWVGGRWWSSAGPNRPGGRHQDDRLVGRSGRLRPAAMGGALDTEVAHLALDNPRVGAQPSRGHRVPQQLSGRGGDGPGQPPRGKSPPGARLGGGPRESHVASSRRRYRCPDASSGDEPWGRRRVRFDAVQSRHRSQAIAPGAVGSGRTGDVLPGSGLPCLPPSTA